MSKGSATALILIALALAAVVAGGLLATNKVSGGAVTNPAEPILSGTCVDVSNWGIVSLWRGDNTASDSIDENDGYWSSAPGYYAGGKVSNAFICAGSYIAVSDSDSLNLPEAFTIEAWINPYTNAAGKRIIVSKPGQYELYINSSGQLIGTVTSSGITHSVSSPSPLSTGWQHVAFVFEPAQAVQGGAGLAGDAVVVEPPTEQPLRLYVNGVRVANTYAGGIIAATTHNLVMGQNFQGLIDEVGIFSTALSAVQIQAIYGADSAGICAVAIPPTVSSVSLSDKTATSAMLHGSANPNGAATTGWFRYSNINPGTCSDSFGTKTADQSIGSGTSASPYDPEIVDGLAPNTKYYFCAIASNSAGKGFGNVLNFTTSSCIASTECPAGWICLRGSCVAPTDDTEPPVVTAFQVPAESTSLIIPITTFTATDNAGVTGYIITETSAQPSASGSGWTATAPASYTFSTAGTKTLYAWAKDAAGNVAYSKNDAVTITLAELSLCQNKNIGSSCTADSGCLSGLKCSNGSISGVLKCRAPADKQAPRISSVTISPANPTTADQITMTITAEDNLGLFSIDTYLDKVWPTGRIGSHGDLCNPTYTETVKLTKNGMLSAGTHRYMAVASDYAEPGKYVYSPAGTNASNPLTWATFTVISPPPVILTIAPASQKGEPGDTLYYNVKVKNNYAAAPGIQFNLTAECIPPAGLDCENWTLAFPNGQSFDEKFAVIKNQEKNTTLAVTAPATATLFKKYTINVTAYDPTNKSLNSPNSTAFEVTLCNRKAPGLPADPSKFKGPAGGEANFTITVTNEDDCTGYFSYAADCPKDWNCTLSKDDSGAAYADGSDNVKLTVISAADADIGSYDINFTAINLKNTSNAGTKTINYTIIACTDADNDTYYAEGGDCGSQDCSDNDPTIHPHAQEFCMDNKDRNCNKVVGSKEQGCNKNQSAYDQLFGRAPSPPPSTEQTATPDCGNDIVETGEDCDGSTDAQCSGLCVSCKCPFIIGDEICDTAARESSAVSEDCKKIGITGLAAIVIGILGALAGGTYYFWRRRGKFSGLAASHGVETATPGVDLDTAVNSMLSEGYKPEEIHSNLEAGGWSHNRISSAMESAQADQEALGKLAEQQGVAAPTEKAKATRYVKKCMELGYDPTQIRTALMSSGWPADTVDGAISKQTAKHIQAHAKKAGVSEPDSAHKEDLGDYVKKELSEGHTKQSIKKALKDAGWQSSDINDAFKE